MAAAICEDATFEDACEAALVLIDEISKVPVEYLRAIGSPMVGAPADFLCSTRLTLRRCKNWLALGISSLVLSIVSFQQVHCNDFVK